MFEHLRGLLKQAPRATPAEDRRLAAAVLLLELARADFEHQPAERQVLRDGLIREFALAPESVDALLADAEQRAHTAVSLHEFVQTVNIAMAPDEKRALLRLLWQVAHADGRVDPHEEHLIRKLADLLHLSHRDYIQAKLDRG